MISVDTRGSRFAKKSVHTKSATGYMYTLLHTLRIQMQLYPAVSPPRSSHEFSVYPDTPPQEICNRINCIRINYTLLHTFKNCNRINLMTATGSTCNRINLQQDQRCSCIRIHLHTFTHSADADVAVSGCFSGYRCSCIRMQLHTFTHFSWQIVNPVASTFEPWLDGN